MRAVYLFQYTRPGSPNAWYISDCVSAYRWVSNSTNRTQLAAVTPTLSSVPAWILDMTLVGPAP